MQVANSRAASDWAAKRKAAMERAAALKAERQARLRERRGSGEVSGLEGVEGVGVGPAAQAPAAAGVWPPAAGPRRTSSQPTSDMPHGNGGGNLPMRPNSEATSGEGHLPEWARDFGANRVPQRRGVGSLSPDFFDGGGFDMSLDNGANVLGGLPEPGSPTPFVQQQYAQQQLYQQYQQQQEYAQQAAGGGGNGYDPAAAAAAASRWPAEMPLGQSDGGIGYAARRAMPRGPPAGSAALGVENASNTSAESFFGMNEQRRAPAYDANKFFGLSDDAPARREPRRRGRASPPEDVQQQYQQQQQQQQQQYQYQQPPGPPRGGRRASPPQASEEGAGQS